MSTLDWNNIGFGYIKTNVNARAYFADGKWSELEFTDDEYIKMHISTTCLHYGLQCFEGLKAFRGVDGKVRITENVVTRDGVEVSREQISYDYYSAHNQVIARGN